MLSHSSTMHSVAPSYVSHHQAASDAALQLLQQAFHAYIEVTADPSSESQKDRLAALQSQMQSKGLHGYTSVQILTQLHDKIAWERFDTQQFTHFYRFTFFLCREPGKRNVQADVAVAAWQLVLQGRFRLLDKFCAYVASSQQGKIVTEDTWRQVWAFARSVHEDLSNYDPNSAWPVLLDEFVEQLRSHGRQSSRHRELSDHDMAQQQEEGEPPISQWLTPARITPVSPDCGSKRKTPSLDTVVDQIDMLPAMVNGSRQPPQHQQSGRKIKHVKRRRLAEHLSPGGGCDSGYFSDGSATPTRSGSVCDASCPGMAEVMTRTVTDALGLG